MFLHISNYREQQKILFMKSFFHIFFIFWQNGINQEVGLNSVVSQLIRLSSQFQF